MNKLIISVPVIIYLFITLYISYYVSKKNDEKKDFISNYYLGNRAMGGFVLAMTIVSTYVGASSFIGGPSIAYSTGLAWVLLASIQLPIIFLTLGILGKKIAILSRKLKAITIFDILRERYDNNFLIWIMSVLVIIFLIASVVAQFIGGGRLFETVLGIDYKLSLTIFAFVVIFYTSFGGFKAVVVTDAIQGLIMMLSTLVLLFVIIYNANGMENIMSNIKNIDPNLLTPDSGGNITKPFILSFWILVGLGVLGLPSTVVRTMGYKDTKSLHKAIIIGTFSVGFLMLGMHLVGFLSKGLEPNLEASDKLIPFLAVKYLNPILAGIFIAGPLASIMSTVDSLLILMSSSIVKDLYLHYKKETVNENKIKKISFLISLIIGIITYVLALNPSNLIVWINLFALAGQEILFLIPLIMGLYWKKGTDKAAISSIFVGLIIFMYLTITKTNIFGLHNIIPALILQIIVYIIVSYFTKQKNMTYLKTFFED